MFAPALKTLPRITEIAMACAATGYFHCDSGECVEATKSALGADNVYNGKESSEVCRGRESPRKCIALDVQQCVPVHDTCVSRQKITKFLIERTTAADSLFISLGKSAFEELLAYCPN